MVFLVVWLQLVLRLVLSAGGNRRFVVLTQPRSGSTWLVKYSEGLARVPGVISVGEALHPEIVDRKSEELLGKKRNATELRADIDLYLRYTKGVYKELRLGLGWRGEFDHSVSQERVHQFPSPKVLGFKIMYHQLPEAGEKNGLPISPKGHGLLQQISFSGLASYLSTKRVLLIHLIRVNQLDRYISISLIRNFNLPYHNNGVPTTYSSIASSKDRNASILPKLSPQAALSYALANFRTSYSLQAYLKTIRNDLQCMTLRYEALIGPGSAALFAELRSRLGLAKGVFPNITNFTSHEHKWAPCEDRVANWDEIMSHKTLAKSVWVAMCRNGNRIIPNSYIYGNPYPIFVNNKYQYPQSPSQEDHSSQNQNKDDLLHSRIPEDGRTAAYYRFKELQEKRRRDRLARQKGRTARDFSRIKRKPQRSQA